VSLHKRQTQHHTLMLSLQLNVHLHTNSRSTHFFLGLYGQPMSGGQRQLGSVSEGLVRLPLPVAADHPSILWNHGCWSIGLGWPHLLPSCSGAEPLHVSANLWGRNALEQALQCAAFISPCHRVPS
jgi:hypothetical protein